MWIAGSGGGGDLAVRVASSGVKIHFSIEISVFDDVRGNPLGRWFRASASRSYISSDIG